MLKGLRSGAVILALAVSLLAGCSAEQLKVADVYQKSAEASTNLKSLGADMKMDMNVEQGGQKMNFNVVMAADVIMKPEMAMHQKVKMNIFGMDNTMETYFHKDAMYMQQTPGAAWVKTPMDLSAVQSQYSSQVDPAAQLEKMKPFMEDLTLKEEKDAYIIHLTASGDKMKEFIAAEMENGVAAGAAGENAFKALSSMVIDQVEISYAIDKKTYLPQTMAMKLGFQMEANGTKVKMGMDTNAVYRDYNKVSEITPPAEVLKAK
jgi:outer membrane lipoprotein-sorting protein